MDLSTTADIELDFPVTFDAERYTKLTMRRPKVKDNLWAERMKATDFERGLKLIARLCDVAPELIEELDEADANKLGEQLATFRGGASEG